MGNSKSVDFTVPENPNRSAFVSFKAWRTEQSSFGTFVVFTYTIRYRRFAWDVQFRYNDIVRLDRTLFPVFGDQLTDVHRPGRFNKLFWTHDHEFLATRSKMMTKYLQDVLDLQTTMNHHKLRLFLSVSVNSFNVNMGRKGKEGWLRHL